MGCDLRTACVPEVAVHASRRSARFTIAGDICVELIPQRRIPSTYDIHILTIRQWRQSREQWDHSSLIIFHDTDEQLTLIERARGNIYRVHDLQSEEGVHPVHSRPSALDRQKGTLHDGSKFAVYRFLLYHDDFTAQKSSFTHGSVGGVYMAPTGLPVSQKLSRRSIHCISVAPRAVSTNVVIHAIIPDLLRDSLRGFPAVTPAGDSVTVFLDFVGFVADYPAVLQVIDTFKAKANVPCAHCTFQVQGGTGYTGSNYTATSAVHSKMTAGVCTWSRSVALREVIVSAEDEKLLGLIKKARVSDVRCPLLFYERELAKLKGLIPETVDGVPVVSWSFSAYRVVSSLQTIASTAA